MSNSSANNYSDADIAVLQAIRTDNYINVALLAVAVYEYAITFLQEAEAISSFLQRGKNSAPAAALFLANRYVGLLYGVVGFIAGVIPTRSSCTVNTRFIEVILLSLMLCFAFFSCFRLYALRVCKYKPLSGLVLLLNLVPFSVNLYMYILSTPALIGPSYYPCLIDNPVSAELERIFVYACRLSSVASDSIVVLAILASTVPQWLEARTLKMKVYLTTAVLSDGSAYFLVLLVMNVFQIITFSLWEEEYLTTFIYLLTPVLSCRIMFNLRSALSNRSPYDDIWSRTSQEELQFSGVIHFSSHRDNSAVRKNTMSTMADMLYDTAVGNSEESCTSSIVEGAESLGSCLDATNDVPTYTREHRSMNVIEEVELRV